VKAIRFHQHGGPEVLRYEDAPTPQPGPGEVLVGLRAAALNHLDLFTRKGDVPKVPLPHIGGADGAGVVAANGPGATRYPAGTRVFFDPGLSDGTCDYCARGEHSLCERWEILGEHRDGTYAQAVVIPEVNLRPIPEGLSFEEAAAFPLVFLTAWRMVVSKARVLPGETVLILGIGGGVALAALQIAKHMGARVLVTSSSQEKLDRARAMGADVLINHKATDFSKEVWGITEYSDQLKQASDQITIERQLPLSPLGPGKYKLEITATDQLNNQKISKTAEFTVKAAPEVKAAAYTTPGR